MEFETSRVRLAREEGKEEGKKEGLLEGLKEGKEEVAFKLLELGLDLSVILQATGLSEVELAALKEGNQG